jgi:hypothetical protein
MLQGNSPRFDTVAAIVTDSKKKKRFMAGLAEVLGLYDFAVKILEEALTISREGTSSFGSSSSPRAQEMQKEEGAILLQLSSIAITKGDFQTAATLAGEAKTVIEKV